MAKKNEKFLKLIPVVIVIALSMGSGTDGLANDGLAMLKNDAAARPAGMGAAAASIAADPNFITYNPASAAALERFTASFGHTIHWENIRIESGCFGTNLKPRLYMHGGIRYAAIDELEKRGNVPTLEPEALFDAHDVSFKTGLAYEVSEIVSVGAALGWYLEEIEGWRGSALNVDLGLIVHPVRDVRLGASVTSLGSDFTITKSGQLGSRDIPLPTTYRLGGAYTWRQVLAAADIVHLDGEAHLHVGTEVEIREAFHLRGGYRSGYDSKAFTAGSSFTIRNVRVDYAFLPFSKHLGTSHLFNLTFSL